MFCNFISKVLIAFAAVGMLSTGAMASQTIHFSQDFTDGSIAAEVGNPVGLFASTGFGLQTMQAWRGGTLTYWGPTGAVAFNPPTGYGQGGAPPAGNGGPNGLPFETGTLGFGGVTGASVVNTAPGAGGVAQLASGNVWVVDMKYISDMAPDNASGAFLAGMPGFSVEVADFASFGDDGFVARGGAATSNTAFSSVYPNGADSNTEPDVLPVVHSASLSTALNSELRAKFVYQPAPGRTGTSADASNPTGLSTRASVQTLAGSSVLGSASHLDGSTVAGNFRSDYSAGLMVQLLNNHGKDAGSGGLVTYASGVTGLSGGSVGGVGVAYNDAENAGNLELGLTNLVFKQVRQSDYNTDGVVNVSGDGSVLVANLGLSGKSFFQGDATGNGSVNVSGDGALFVAQLGTDLVGSGAGLAEYNPITGQVLISTNGAGFIEVSSSINQLIPGAAVATGSVPNAFTSDPFTSGAINYLGFSPLGTGGILNDFSIGAVLPPGILGSIVPNALFRWAPVGGGAVLEGPIHIIPEPTSFVLAGFAGVALVVAARRRRAH